MFERHHPPEGAGNFLTDNQQTVWFRWPGQLLAVVCAIALTAGLLHLLTPGNDRIDTAAVNTSPAAAAQGFAAAAAAAFTDSSSAASAPLPAAQRSAGLPTDPVTGLTSSTPAGPVQLVLPAGLGPAQHTSGGQVVYPDTGAGFDFLAENTATGTRTVSRINSPAGVRAVTTFVRTPADTVMLAHTNGYLTVNRATPTAETIGMFSPAETRDSAGKLVPSSYVVRQIRPQLYQLSEVIDPHPDTVWPVYVDPPLHVTGPGGGPLPQFSFSDVTGALSGAASAVSGAVATAASATVTGAKAVGSFVKENPLESAMLVGGVALALTGVGGPAGAAAIAAATVNLSSAGLDIAAAAMPDNELLGDIATGVSAMSMLTPQGAGKKIVEEGVKAVGEQVVKHADDIVDVAKAAPTPPTQLAGEITASVAKPPVVPGVSPKAPNAPPTAGGFPPPGGTTPPGFPPTGGKPPPGHGPDGPRSLPAGCTLDCGHQTPAPAGVYSETEIPGHYNANLDSIQGGKPSLLDRVLSKKDKNANRRAAIGDLPPAGKGSVNHEYPHASAQQGGKGADTYQLSHQESNVERDIMGDLYQRQHVDYGDPYTTAYRGDDGLTRCPRCAIDRRDSGNEPRTAADRNAAVTAGAVDDREDQSSDRQQQGRSSGGLNSRSNDTSGGRNGSDRDTGSNSGKKDQQKKKKNSKKKNGAKKTKKKDKKKKRKTQAQKKRKKKDGR